MNTVNAQVSRITLNTLYAMHLDSHGERFSSITRTIDGGGSISHAIVLRTGQLPLRLTKLCASLQGASQPCMQPQEFHAVTSLTSTSRLESNRSR